MINKTRVRINLKENKHHGKTGYIDGYGFCVDGDIAEIYSTSMAFIVLDDGIIIDFSLDYLEVLRDEK